MNTGHGKSNILTGSTSFTTPGCYTWYVPSGVSSISVFGISGGGGGFYGLAGGGGGSSWRNSWPVTTGQAFSIKVGVGGTGKLASSGGTCGGPTYMLTSSTYVVRAYPGSANSAGAGYCGSTTCPNGGSYWKSNFGGAVTGTSAGGAAGYGPYQNGHYGFQAGYGCQFLGGGGNGWMTGTGCAGIYNAGSGGGAGGGGSLYQIWPPGNYYNYGEWYNAGGGGGGVGLCGQGSSGGKITTGLNGNQAERACSSSGYFRYTGIGGNAGSGGASGGDSGPMWPPNSLSGPASPSGGNGGSYGGGGGGSSYVVCHAFCCYNGSFSTYAYGFGYYGGSGGGGALVIIYPGNTRKYPSTNTTR
jgi:hypothetical protein